MLTTPGPDFFFMRHRCSPRAAVLMRESVTLLCGAVEMQPGCDDSDIWNVTRGVVSGGASFKACINSSKALILQ